MIDKLLKVANSTKIADKLSDVIFDKMCSGEMDQNDGWERQLWCMR